MAIFSTILPFCASVQKPRHKSLSGPQTSADGTFPSQLADVDSDWKNGG
jgi:hypothetical protein